MAARVSENEVKKAVTMAGRKAGVTRKQLAERLSVDPGRAKTVLDHAMRNGHWSVDKKGQGKDGRTLIYRCARNGSGAKKNAKKKNAKKKKQKK